MANATNRAEEHPCYLVPDEEFEREFQAHRDVLRRARESRPLTFGRLDAANAAGTMEHARRFSVFKPSAFGELL